MGMKFKLYMVSGLRKSGTTLTKTLLDGHPELFVIPPAEFDFFCYSHHHSLVQPKYDNIEDPNALLRRLVNQDFITRMNKGTKGSTAKDVRETFNVPGFLAQASKAKVGSYPEIFAKIFTAMASNCGVPEEEHPSRKFVFKNTLETEFFGLYKTWFPKMKLLYVLRNPYAQFAAQSRGEYIKGRKFEYPLLAPYINIMKYDYYFLNYWREIYQDDIKIVHYEDLVLETESVMREVADFFDITFEDSMLTPTILGESWGGNSSAKGEVYGGVDAKPLHRWKSVLSEQEKYIVTKYFGDMVQRYGYEVHPGKRSPLPLHRTESLRRFVGNKYLEYTPYY